MRRRLAFLALCGLGLWVQPLLRAEEGGSGHYLPGAMSSFVDGVPPKGTFVARYNLVHYNGSVSLDQPLPIAGLSTVGAEATSWAHGLSLLGRPPLDLGERWSYALSATKFGLRDGKPVMVRLPELNFIDDKAGKPAAIQHHIGRRPVMAFGNSDGDIGKVTIKNLPEK